MGGQVLGGGVIVLVAVLLWLVYLLPSWHQRRQFDAAERNAVRLNQALRILAETSETPGEVKLELTARTAMAQQKLAKQALAERESADLEQARRDLEHAREARVAAREAARIEDKRAEAQAKVDRRVAKREARRVDAAARRSRARRRMRLTAVLVALAGLAAAGWGFWQMWVGASGMFAWIGSVAVVGAIMTLQRMAQVTARAGRGVEAVAEERIALPHLQDVALEAPAQRAWAPRELPRPLSASAGSRAAAVLDQEAARDALRRAALEESMRTRAAEQQPPSIETARTARAVTPVARPAASLDYGRMGVVDDAEIEAHVRRLLEKRAVGA